MGWTGTHSAFTVKKFFETGEDVITTHTHRINTAHKHTHVNKVLQKYPLHFKTSSV